MSILQGPGVRNALTPDFEMQLAETLLKQVAQLFCFATVHSFLIPFLKNFLSPDV